MHELNTKEEKTYAIAEITVMIMHFVRLFIATPLYAVQYRTMLSRSGRDRNFIDPSIPQENRLCSGPMATCVTPEVEPMFLKNVLLLCSPGKLTTSWWTSNPHTCKMIREKISNVSLTTTKSYFSSTESSKINRRRQQFFYGGRGVKISSQVWGICTLISPSEEPVTKYSSSGSIARHLIGTSWAWKVCRSCRWRMSNIQTSPFLPPEIRSWWWGAYTMAGHPCSWQMKAVNR